MSDPAPAIFGLPPGVDFAPAVLAGLKDRLGADPLSLARCRIIVNTERAARRFADVAAATAVSLPPRITVLGALVHEVPGLPPERSALALRLRLAQLVRGLLSADPTAGARASAFPLADTLAALLGEMRIEDVPFSALRGLNPADEAGHWARSLQFLDLIEPLLRLSDPEETDADHRLCLALVALAARWTTTPPSGPVIIAGSTGSRGATARFMAALSRIPGAAVVLPGVDQALPPDVWALLSDTDGPSDHPQSALAKFCTLAGADPARLPLWSDTPPASPARNSVLSLALRPAPVTDQWLRDGPGIAPQLGTAMGQVTLLDSDDTVEEARAIAVTLRRAIATGQKAALITPDRTLARRVTAALDRWSIRPDDSAGRPLAQTPPGVFLRLTAGLLVSPPDPVSLIALLKHPLAGGPGPERGHHLGAVRWLERELRGLTGPDVTASSLSALTPDAPDIRAWRDWLVQLLPDPLPAEAPLESIVARHRAFAEGLAAGPALWEATAGRAAANLWSRLETAAPSGGAVPLGEYPTLLQAILQGEEVPEDAFVPTPGVHIWGTLEARTLTADVVILGGLAEGLWPRLPTPDPWLSRTMRGEVGLTLPERQIGLSAHDFQQAAAAPQIVLSCPRRDGEAPTVPARWLLRLINLMEGLGEDGTTALEGMRARGAEILRLTRALDRPEAMTPRMPRPAPVPPASDFPAKLPVTRIETLLRDPYAIYAQYILRLRPLDPLLRAADSRERGTRMHQVLERFVDATRAGLPSDAAALFDQIVDKTLAEAVPWPTARAFWSARFRALRETFLASEAQRRTIAPPNLLEAKGSAAHDGTLLPFTLTAQADRLDAGPSGPTAIYDYKGGLPSEKEIKRFAPQLPLEAAIAMRGGFPELGAREIAALCLISTKPDAGQREVPSDTDSINAVWEALGTVVSAFQVGGMAYPARARAGDLAFSGPYDHLARLGEWDDSDLAVEMQVP